MSALACALPADPLADDFRTALRSVAGAVAIVTAADSIARAAVTMTAVTAVSMAPPSLLICVNRSASIFPILMRGVGFCVNYLNAGHEALARLCSDSASTGRRFEDPEFESREGKSPHLATAMARIQCDQDGRYIYGTHAIVIGRVSGVARGPDAPGLLYAGGLFTQLSR